MFREAMKLENQHDKPKQDEPTNNGSKHHNTIQGNTKAYSIDRVKRECEPEVESMFREAMKEQGQRTDLGNNVPEVERQARDHRRRRSLRFTSGIACERVGGGGITSIHQRRKSIRFTAG
jgi:ubiquitin